MRLSGQTLLVVDNGMNVELARFLGRECGEVMYWTPWQGESPLWHDAHIGDGFPEIKRVSSWIAQIDKADVIVFPDLCYGPDQVWLRERGHHVWGSGMAEELEFDRIKTKEMMKKMGLPVWDYEVCNGYSELVEHIKNNKDMWVKISKYRAHFETEHLENYDQSRVWLAKLYVDILPVAEKIKFCVEKNMPHAFEIAVDTMFSGGQFPKNVMQGIEVKNLGYVGMIEPFENINPALTEFDKAMIPYLKAKGYCNFWSAEKRTGKDKIAYMNDVAGRAPSPPSETYPLAYPNLAEIIVKGAMGEFVEPTSHKDKFFAEFMIKTTNDQDWQLVQFPKEYADNIKLRNVCKVDGQYWVTPKECPNDVIGAIVTGGRTKDEAVEKCVEISKTVSGNGVHIAGDALRKVDDEIDKAKKFGISVLGE